MDIKIDIPNYITIKQFQTIAKLDQLPEIEKNILTISTITNTDFDLVKQWDPEKLAEINKIIFNNIDLDDTTFYPVIEFNNVKYGFTPINKLTLGEYMDLERLCKTSTKNLQEIMAILYRPIQQDKTKSIKYSIKNGIKITQGKAENLFNYYTVEKYDANWRKLNSQKFDDFPISMALGALSFFLLIGSKCLNNINHYLENQTQLQKNMSKQMDQLLSNIGDGLAQYIDSRKHPSLISQETKVFLN